MTPCQWCLFLCFLLCRHGLMDGCFFGPFLFSSERCVRIPFNFLYCLLDSYLFLLPLMSVYSLCWDDIFSCFLPPSRSIPLDGSDSPWKHCLYPPGRSHATLCMFDESQRENAPGPAATKPGIRKGLHRFVYIDSTAPLRLCVCFYYAPDPPNSLFQGYSPLNGSDLQCSSGIFLSFVERLWVPGLGIRDGFHHWKNRSLWLGWERLGCFSLFSYGYEFNLSLPIP